MPSKRRNPPARYVLPETVEPPGTKCFTIHVPNEKNYLAAFRGQMEALARAYAWGDDEAHTAIEAAARWRSVLDGMGDCGVPDIQFRQPSNCELQYSVDGGITWLHAGNFADCAAGKILDAIADGTVATPGQQPAGGTIPVTECKTYHITLRGNDVWHSPNPVYPGYTITVSNAKGGWADKYSILDAWWSCPDGQHYSLGACVGSYEAGHADDPLPSLYHMRLVGYCSGNATYMDMFNRAYEIPGSAGTSEFYLQANNHDLSLGAGEITLDVEICNVAWCYQFMGGHGLGIAYAALGTYDAPSDSIHGTAYGAGFQSQIELIMPAGTYAITRIEENITVGANPNANGSQIRNLTPLEVYASTAFASGTYTLTATSFGTLGPGDTLNCNSCVGPGGQPGPATINWLRIHGTGINPFGASNC